MVEKIPWGERVSTASDVDKEGSGLESLIGAIGRASRATPAIRGKNRLYLALLRALGAESRRTVVVVPLSQPVEYRAELDLRSWLQRLAFVSGSYESETVDFLIRLYQAHPQRGAIFDIGANVGLISIPLAILLRRSDASKSDAIVCAFEPISDNFAQLKRNVELNGLGRAIRLFHVALGDERKIVDIQVEGNLAPGEGSGTANILSEKSTYQCTRIPTALRPLDEMVLMGEIDSNVSVIKIDTDGYDLKIFEGARGLLMNARPVAYGEFDSHCLSWHDQSIGSVRAFAQQVGYEVFAKIPSAFRFPRKADDDNFVRDLLFIPREHVSRYAWCLL
jgi:FkbM family methyltransferase